MRVELCAWRDALQLMQNYPTIKRYELAEAVKVTDHTATEFMKTYTELYPGKIQRRPVKTKQEINAKYYKKNKGRYQNQMYSSRSAASQNRHESYSKNY